MFSCEFCKIFKNNFFQNISGRLFLYVDKKSHWLQVSGNKLLGDQPGNIKMFNRFFGQTFRKRTKTEKEHHHQILHIRKNLSSKFQLKLTILNFGIKFVQKGYFRSKTQKENITI